jgi:hypothetical protein
MLETGASSALRWRFAGQQIPLEQYAQAHWDGVHASFVYTTASPSDVLGSLVAYGADPRHGFCYLAVAMLDGTGNAVRDAVVTAESLVLFVDFLLQGWNFRKIYFEVAEFNMAQIESVLQRCTCEGMLQDHVFMAGRYWSVGTWSFSRDQWPSLRSHVVGEVGSAE